VIQEIANGSYPGVVCCHCTGKIAVAGRSAARYQELKENESNEREELNSRVFTLRCQICEKERVYGFREIREFEGAPPVRVPRPKRGAAKMVG